MRGRRAGATAGLRDVRLRLGTTDVIRGVTLELPPGSLTVVRGGNGSGKSTLLGIAAGLLQPDSGTAVVPRSVGYLPEQFRPPGSLSAARYLDWARSARRDTRSGRAGSAMTTLEQLDLRGATDGPMRDLSKGNLQKVGLVQAFQGPPALIVLDEPLSGLDEAAREATAILVQQCVDRDSAVLVAQHGEHPFGATRTVILEHGDLVEDGESPRTSKPLTPVRETRTPRTFRIVAEPDTTVTVAEPELAATIAALLDAGRTITRVEPGER